MKRDRKNLHTTIAWKCVAQAAQEHPSLIIFPKQLARKAKSIFSKKMLTSKVYDAIDLILLDKEAS